MCFFISAFHKYNPINNQAMCVRLQLLTASLDNCKNEAVIGGQSALAVPTTVPSALQNSIHHSQLRVQKHSIVGCLRAVPLMSWGGSKVVDLIRDQIKGGHISKNKDPLRIFLFNLATRSPNFQLMTHEVKQSK